MATYNKKRIDKQQLKEKVAQVAAVAFMQKGIKNVKMDDVAAELGISKRTIYELFSDKEELLLDVVKLHRKEMKNYMISVAEKAENVLEIIMSFYIRTTEDFQTTNILFFEEIKKYPQVTKFLEEGRKENAVSAVAFYKKGVEQGIFREDVNYEIVQEMIHGQMDMLIHNDIRKTYSMVEIFKTVVFMHLRGITTEKGLSIVDEFLEQMNELHKN
jgi:AcrR family transcriptional regulator